MVVCVGVYIVVCTVLTYWWLCGWYVGIVIGSRGCVLLIVGVVLAKVLKSFSDYGEELRQINAASTIRRGKNVRGNPPRGFEDVFSYVQPRRNRLGAGDLKVTNTNTGEITMYKADEVSRAFTHIRSPKHSQYSLSYDKRDKVDPT